MKTTKKGIGRKLIWVLVVALIITAAIPLSSMGSEGAEVKVNFLIDEVHYADVTIPVNGESADDEGSTYFSKMQYPDDPVKEGFTFTGWTDGENIYTKEGDEQFKITIGSDIILNAVFTENKTADGTSSKAAINESNETDSKTGKAGSSNVSDAAEETSYAKVTFKKNAGDDDSYYEETVEKETMVSNWPADPEDKSDGKPFLYWYDAQAAEDANGVSTPFNSLSIITGDTVLLAKYENGYIVKFHDTDGTVLDETAVTEDNPVRQTTKSVELDAGENIEYWYVKGNENDAYDFNAKVTENMDLYPKVTKNAVVYFDTNGSYVAPQVVIKGQNASMPQSEPIRAGYDFKGWSHSAAKYDEFDFKKEIINEDVTTVYAYWETGNTTYTVNLWNEKANIAGDPGSPSVFPEKYEMVGSKRIASSSGAIVNYTTDDVVKIYKEIGGNAYNTLCYSDFYKSDSKGVEGNGTTVIDVYFKRTPFKFTFYPTKDTSKKTVDENAKVVINGEAKSEATITLKVGQNLANLWPSEVVDSSNAFSNWNKYAGNASKEVFVGMSPLYVNLFSQQTSPSDTTYSKANNYQKPAKKEFDLYATYLTEKQLASVEQRWYYTEDLDQTSTETSNTRVKFTDGKYYSLNVKGAFTNQGTNLATMAKNGIKGTELVDWSGVAIDGFRQVKKEELPDGKFDTTYLGTNRTLKKATQDDVFTGGLTESEYTKYNTFGSKKDLLYIFKYYMQRESYKLNLVTNGGTLSENDAAEYTVDKAGDYSKKFKFEEKISPVADPVKENYIFKGWYTDPVMMNDSTKVTFGKKGSIQTMPASEITLYAKFVGAPAKVSYHDGDKTLYTQDTNLYVDVTPKMTGDEVDGIDYSSLEAGNKVDGKGIFKGWFYQPTENSELVSFDIKPFKVEKTGYDIYAKWTPVDYTLTYIDDLDGNNTTVAAVTIKSTKNTLSKSQKQVEKLPAEKGFTFSWNTKADGSGARLTGATPLKGDMKVYLIKTKNKYRASFDVNGGEAQPDPQTVAYEELVKKPEEVTQNGYIFEGWALKSGDKVVWNFEKDRMPASDIELVAQWKNLSDDPEVPGTTDPDDTGSDGSEKGVESPDTTVDPEPAGSLAGPGTSYPANEGPGATGNGTTGSNGIMNTGPTVSEMISSGMVPTANIGDKDVPLYSKGLFDSWALLNLILCIAGGLLAIYTTIRAMFRKNREESEKKRKTGISWLVATGIFAIGGIILFLLTEDTNTTMVMTDMWTIGNAFLFAASVIGMIFTLRREQKEDTGTTVTP